MSSFQVKSVFVTRSTLICSPALRRESLFHKRERKGVGFCYCAEIFVPPLVDILRISGRRRIFIWSDMPREERRERRRADCENSAVPQKGHNETKRGYESDRARASQRDTNDDDGDDGDGDAFLSHSFGRGDTSLGG